MAYQPVNVVEVRCWGERVGALALDPRSGYYVFEYDEPWRRSGIELAPTTMPLSGETRFVFPTLPLDTYYRLPSMVADSLPDDFGNALTTAYLANQGVRAEHITPLDRLAYLGSRAMGALEFRPLRGPRTRKSTAIELSELVLAARSALVGDLNSEEGITDALSHLIAVGTSAGGARVKAVVALNSKTGELRSGQVPADPGFEQWILKLDGVGDGQRLGAPKGFGRIEYAYHLMAIASGIEMSPCRLLEESGRAHFMTKRFDRDSTGGKLHMQTLCALGELDFRQIGVHDYSQLFQVINRLELSGVTRAEAFRRMVFNVAAANCDDHTKNHSFLLDPSGEWRLSPAYDVTHAYDPENVWIRQHLMSVNGNTVDIGRDDLLEVADRYQVPDARSIIADVLDATASWNEFAKNANVDTATKESIARDIDRVNKPLH